MEVRLGSIFGRLEVVFIYALAGVASLRLAFHSTVCGLIVSEVMNEWTSVGFKIV